MPGLQLSEHEAHRLLDLFTALYGYLQLAHGAAQALPAIPQRTHLVHFLTRALQHCEDITRLLRRHGLGGGSPPLP